MIHPQRQHTKQSEKNWECIVADCITFDIFKPEYKVNTLLVLHSILSDNQLVEVKSISNILYTDAAIIYQVST